MKNKSKNTVIIILSIVIGLLLIWVIAKVSFGGQEYKSYQELLSQYQSCVGNNSVEHKFCPWAEFTSQPTNKNFEMHISKEKWDSSPQVLTSDCWQELIKTVYPKDNEGICRIRDVTATNRVDLGTVVTCECYYKI